MSIGVTLQNERQNRAAHKSGRTRIAVSPTKAYYLPDEGQYFSRPSSECTQVRGHGSDFMNAMEGGHGTHNAAQLLHAYRNEVVVQPPWAQDPEMLRQDNQRRGAVGRSGGASVPAGRHAAREREDGVGFLLGRGAANGSAAPAARGGTPGGPRASPPLGDERRAASRDAPRTYVPSLPSCGRAGPRSSQSLSQEFPQNQDAFARRASGNGVPSTATQRSSKAGSPHSLGPPPRDGCATLLRNVAFEPNSNFRAYMEDVAVVVDPFMVGDGGEDVRWGFFGVYDGHGGRQAVDYCESKLHCIVLDELRAAARMRAGGALADDTICDVLTRTFQRVDDQLRLVGAWRCGCTVTVVLVRRTSASLRLYVANVGDSRSIVIDSSRREARISQDHRPTDVAEVRRIESEGGFVSRGRVSGQLGVSRALGDLALKGSGVSWRPHIHVRNATHDAALIIASDGLWDSMGDADAKHVLLRCLSDRAPEYAAEHLVREAERRGSTDNITCLVAYFDGATHLGLGSM